VTRAVVTWASGRSDGEKADLASMLESQTVVLDHGGGRSLGGLNQGLKMDPSSYTIFSLEAVASGTLPA